MTETAALVKSAHAIRAPNTGGATTSLARCASNAGTLRPGKPSISSSRCPSSSPIPRPQGNNTAASLCSRRITKSSRRSLTLSSLPVPKSHLAHASPAGSGTSRIVSPNTLRVRIKPSPAQPALDHQINSARPPPPAAAAAPPLLNSSSPSYGSQLVGLPLRSRASTDSLPTFNRSLPLAAVEETSPSPSSAASDEFPSQILEITPNSPATSFEAAKSPSNQSSKRSSAASDDSFTAHHLRLQAIEETLLSSGTTSITETILAGRSSQAGLIPLLSESSSTTNDKRRSVTHRHQISLRSSLSNPSLPSTPVRVPPIRGFRSSGSRKSSLIIDMNATTQQTNAIEDGAANDHTLRLSNGQVEHDALHISTPTSTRQSNVEDSSDIFLNIAREEAYRRAEDERFYGGSYTPVSSSGRLGHRRPLSTSVAYYQPMSPPKLTRRLSDQQERPNLRAIDDDQSSQASRSSTFRSMLREKAASSHPAEELSRARGGGVSLRQSPAPRSPVYHDEAYQHSRRRASVTDSTPPVSGRQYKSAILGHGHRKTYSSSPLIQSLEGRGQQSANLMDGTESTTSTTAPSTVWDELDDLKSRINRLELTGKLPPTSAAAVARMSDERPATATTTVTSASLSPKRQPTLQLDTHNGVSSHPLLLTALTKSKQLLGPGVYQALESAAHDALGLSQMMGTAGQGPISSGASAIASGSTPSITDRQLRRKADSVCRSLTELCLALNENMAQGTVYAQAQAQTPIDNPRATPTTPTIPRSAGGLPNSRRSSVTADSNPPPPGSASRVLSKYEERRSAHFSAPPISLYTNPHNSTPEPGASRRSSLLISRTRRGQTEEPEEGRESPFLRSRRTERVDAEDGRRSSLLMRSRRGSVDQNDEPQLGSPIKARSNLAADYSPESQTPTTETDQAGLPRRFVSDFQSRITIPAGPATPHQRRYLDRATPDREISTRTPDFNVMRRLSLHSRNNSLGSRRVNRDSMTPSGEATTAAE